jgi:MFS family permease
MPMRTRSPLFALYAANAISIAGNVMALVAIPWFVLERSGSPALAGLVAFFTTLPAVIAAFFGGVVVDRLGFRRMSVVADLASAVAIGLIPLLDQTIGLEIWVLMALVFAGALLDAPGTTARQAILPDLAQLAGMPMERATGIAQAIQRGSLLLGAPIAGGLIAVMGVSNVLWLDAASFLFSAALVGLLVPRPRPPDAEATPEGYVAQLAAGLRFIRRDRLIRALVGTVLLTNFLDAPIFSVLLPVYAQQLLGSALELGIMVGVFGAAALLGAGLFGAIGHRLPRRITFATAFVVVGLPMFLLALTPPFPLPAVALGLIGLAAGPINPIISTVLYERIPAAMRGRVLGTITAGAFVAIPLGVLVAGFVVERIGLGNTFLAIAICYLVVTASIWVNPAMREMDVRK